MSNIDTCLCDDEVTDNVENEYDNSSILFIGTQNFTMPPRDIYIDTQINAFTYNEKLLFGTLDDKSCESEEEICQSDSDDISSCSSFESCESFISYDTDDEDLLKNEIKRAKIQLLNC
jgi:hypothetical protein